ncbi:hypothetical protein RHMOL_Rhmol02G0308700 [Rhododendron molle]|uniref:Uncharacterized protein n=1 Tax=Rhododendron molle TaxID=49168 RepID=A0ACC0PW82_RHOML|nr:hypothetical protein RHMOL_Rhmol02G0308700 [Rhododendron molle]
MKKSWTLLFIISNLTLRHWDTLEPLCYTKDGEALMKVSMDRDGHGIRAYSLDDILQREIPIQPNHYYVNAIRYEESLVTPTGYDWEQEEQRMEATFTDFWYRDRLEPLSYTKDGEALMKVSTDRDGHGTRTYNLDDNLQSEIPIQPNHYYVNAMRYEASLVTPIGYNWEAEELRGEAAYTNTKKEEMVPGSPSIPEREISSSKTQKMMISQIQMKYNLTNCSKEYNIEGKVVE